MQETLFVHRGDSTANERRKGRALPDYAHHNESRITNHEPQIPYEPLTMASFLPLSGPSILLRFRAYANAPRDPVALVVGMECRCGGKNHRLQGRSNQWVAHWIQQRPGWRRPGRPMEDSPGGSALRARAALPEGPA